MIYDKENNRGDGVWHCPFPKSGLNMMQKASKHCSRLSAEYIELSLNHYNSEYHLPPGDFLSEPQDSRGLPLSWCIIESKRFEKRITSCIDIYDYDSIPEIVITDGKKDWPMKTKRKVLQA